MSNETTKPSDDQLTDAVQHIQKTLKVIDRPPEASFIRLVKHADGGTHLLLENNNILHAKNAFYLVREGVLLVNGYDPEGVLYFDGLTLPIIKDELPINARDAIVSRGALSVINAFLSSAGKSSPEPYVIDCLIIDPDAFVKEVKPFPETFTHEGFKCGIEISNGIKGELIITLTEASQYLTLDEVMGLTYSHETVLTEGSAPGFEIEHEMSIIKIGGFEIRLRDKCFLELAASSSIERPLQ